MRLNKVENLTEVGMALVVVPNQVRRHPLVGLSTVFVSSERTGVLGNHVRGEFRLNELGGRPRRGESQEGIGA